MGNFKNSVRLMGNVGETPTVTSLENGKKVARFSLAVNQNYRDSEGNKQTRTDWATIVCWDKKAEIVEKYVDQGKLVGIDGQWRSRSYQLEDGNTRYVTEVKCDDIVLLSSSKKEEEE